MATKVKYTGDRTGKAVMPTGRYGAAHKGDILVVPDDVAERWATPSPTRQAGTAEDLEKAWTVDELRVIARDHGLDESGKKSELAERIHKADPHIAPGQTASDWEIVGRATDDDDVSSATGEGETVKAQTDATEEG